MHIHRVAVVKNESNVSTSIKSQYLVNKAPVAGEAQKHPRMIWMHEPWKQNLVHYSSDSGHCHSDISKWPDSQTSEKKQQNTRGKHMPPSHFATEQPNGSPQVSLCVADEKGPLLFFFKVNLFLSFSFHRDNTLCLLSPKQCCWEAYLSCARITHKQLWASARKRRSSVDNVSTLSRCLLVGPGVCSPG